MSQAAVGFVILSPSGWAVTVSACLRRSVHQSTTIHSFPRGDNAQILNHGRRALDAESSPADIYTFVTIERRDTCTTFFSA
ncbi:hypothetical protein BC827DRAFT_1251826 [Russula dissimulans]|nr:hypothetical protein BC827DRAFT_1251826 [Russula dissimulans]